MSLEKVNKIDAGTVFEYAGGTLRLLGDKSLAREFLNDENFVGFCQRLLEFRLKNPQLANISSGTGQGKCTFVAGLLNSKMESLYGKICLPVLYLQKIVVFILN